MVATMVVQLSRTDCDEGCCSRELSNMKDKYQSPCYKGFDNSDPLLNYGLTIIENRRNNRP